MESEWMDIPYNAWLHWIGPTRECNFNCFYCGIHGHINGNPREVPDLLSRKPVVPIAIEKFVQAIDKTNKIFKISFAGEGEPFLIPNIVDLCIALTEK